MIPFGTEKNIGKPYCLPTLTGWTVWPIYIVRNIKTIERSDLNVLFKYYIISWDFV